MIIQYFGQNTFIFTLNKAKIVSDPAVSVNPLSSDIELDEIDVTHILVTHAHKDHVADVVPIAQKNNATVIANYEIASHYGKMGISYHPMNHGGKWQFDFGTIAMVNAVHTSSFEDGSYGGQPAGFVIMADGRTVYLAGDTALSMDMKTIPMVYPKLDLAILPIGDNFTMGIDEAIVACDLVGCNNLLGCHYDTFPYIKIDHNLTKQKCKEAGINLTLLEIGSSISV